MNRKTDVLCWAILLAPVKKNKLVEDPAPVFANLKPDIYIISVSRDVGWHVTLFISVDSNNYNRPYGFLNFLCTSKILSFCCQKAISDNDLINRHNI